MNISCLGLTIPDSEPWNPGTLEPWNFWNPGTLEPPGALELWNLGALEHGILNPETLEPPGTLEPWNLGTSERCGHAPPCR